MWVPEGRDGSYGPREWTSVYQGQLVTTASNVETAISKDQDCTSNVTLFLKNS
jgi:hypothetical protein